MGQSREIQRYHFMVTRQQVCQLERPFIPALLWQEPVTLQKCGGAQLLMKTVSSLFQELNGILEQVQGLAS
jgi:hypothetical protein